LVRMLSPHLKKKKNQAARGVSTGRGVLPPEKEWRMIPEEVGNENASTSTFSYRIYKKGKRRRFLSMAHIRKKT